MDEKMLLKENLKEISTQGNFHVLEHQRDLSVSHVTSFYEYCAAEMNVRKRQLLLDFQNSSYIVQAGAMQWIKGNINTTSDVKGVGDLIGKIASAAVTKESTIKPLYSGNGVMMLEPTYRHIILLDVSQWGTVVLDDGLFLACDASLQQKTVARSNISSAVLGGEGLFNSSFTGNGILALESHVPYDELIEVVLDNDVIKIDGNMAIAWSGSLQFTVEKSTKSLIGSAVSGEGFVNVYRGTGKILMAPTAKNVLANPTDSSSANAESKSKTQTKSNIGKVFGVVSDIVDIFV